MNNIKQLIPCIYLKDKKAVSSFNDETVVSTDPVSLATKYCENGADSIVVFDFSKEDKEHEEALDIIKDICNQVSVPVIGAGNVKRMEDIKKLLYAGCSKACLNYSLETNVEITKEVSLKFGKDKIAACINLEDEIINNQEILDEFVSSIIVINESLIRNCVEISTLPVIVTVPDISLDKILEIMSEEKVLGLTGPFINANSKEFDNIKNLCKENGISVRVLEPSIPWNELKLNSDGMIPVIVQDYKTNEVLMCAYMNEEAYNMTVRTGRMTYFSRSRNELWIKGETSSHYQYLKELKADCDKDTLLAKVYQVGAACHTGSYSCFFNEVVNNNTSMDESNPLEVFEKVLDIIKDRKVNPKEGSYTNYLFDKGIDKILKKLGEEATEIVIAAKNPNPNEIKYEISDFLYHMMVLMVEKNVTWEEITEELDKR
ncbi:MAG: bifunctional phosphoribosyl-AMP cyclohydrolase/phosphoribosyl-ATP diphosphatase HisIE [Lachnospiraceae bacterium]|nr:bifunctional phosphoribosyl-AMP cyclohydrolase/phosphoribosyl-ATP diphosphatase HisIE [Lachnospiraceae bacterium]